MEQSTRLNFADQPIKRTQIVPGPITPAAAGDVTAAQAAADAAQADADALDLRVDDLEAATNWSALADYADDTAAASGGVAIGNLYRTGSVVKVRVA